MSKAERNAGTALDADKTEANACFQIAHQAVLLDHRLNLELLLDAINKLRLKIGDQLEASTFRAEERHTLIRLEEALKPFHALLLLAAPTLSAHPGVCRIGTEQEVNPAAIRDQLANVEHMGIPRVVWLNAIEAVLKGVRKQMLEEMN